MPGQNYSRRGPEATLVRPTVAGTRPAWLLAAVAFVVYVSSLHQTVSGDTVPTRLLAFSLVREHDLDLDEFPWLRPDVRWPYFLDRGRNGHVVSHYPVASALLAAPLAAPVVWWQRALGVDDDDVRFRLATLVVERVTAALIAAASVGMVYLAAAQVASAPVAVALAAGYAFGSSTWSLSGQALWQHGLAQLSLAGMSLALLGPPTRRNGVAAGGWAALAVAARPIMLFAALVAAAFVWRERRRHVGSFLIPAAAGAVLLLAYNLVWLGTPNGGYHGGAFAVPRLEYLAGLLFSPSRGLLIFSPLAALAVSSFLCATSPAARWLKWLGVVIAGHLALFTCFSIWWAGNCYGPRYLTDVLPACALCAVPAVERLWRRRAGRALLGVVAAWSVAVQAIGAYCDDGTWNTSPVFVDHAPQRLWDWRDAHTLRALRGGWRGAELAPLLGQMFTDRRPALLRPLTAEQLAGAVAVAAPFPWRARAGGLLSADITVTNRAEVVWPVFTDWGDLTVGVLYRWWHEGQVVPGIGETVPIWRNVGPGESVPVLGRFDVPARPGSYELEFVVVQKLGPASGRAGSATLRGRVEVE